MGILGYNCGDTTMLYSTVLLKCRDPGVYHGWGLWLIIVVVVVERLGVRVGAIVWKLLELGNRCWGKAGPGRLSSSDRIKENNLR